MGEQVIVLTDLTKQYGNFTAVDHIRLNIRKGEIFGLLGPNGAGKSTTILMMLGLTEPTSGTVEICGINSTTHPIEVKRKIGYLPEDVGFYDDMTGPENLIYTARLNGISDKEAKTKAMELMKRVGLEDQLAKKTGKYSRGMRQRLGLADVLIKNPEIIILDEPTSGLDTIARDEILDLLREYMETEGRSILISSHISTDLETLCDEIYMIHNGGIVLHEETDCLFDQYGVLKVSEEQFRTLDKQYLLRTLKEPFGYSCLTNEKAFYVENYPAITIERGNIDNIITTMIRGENNERITL